MGVARQLNGSGDIALKRGERRAAEFRQRNLVVVAPGEEHEAGAEADQVGGDYAPSYRGVRQSLNRRHSATKMIGSITKFSGGAK